MRLAEDESGMTLAEVLVSLVIFSILTTLLFTTVLSGSNSAKTVRQNSDLTEESRLVLNRMSRELRQASRIISVTNPDYTNAADGSPRTCGTDLPPCFDPNADTKVTFQTDLDGDGIINTTDPSQDIEELTYHYDRPNGRLLLEAATAPLGGVPVLSANVTAFKLSYRSSDYNCDVNSNGQVTWQEIEASVAAGKSPPCPVATVNNVLDGGEIPVIDQIIIDLTVLTGVRQQQFRTQVDLRNRN